MLSLIPSDAALIGLQAGVVAAPAVAPAWASRWIGRFRGRAWAIVPVASIVGVILLIRYASGTAAWLTWLALIAVPLLAIVALGWLMRGARPVWALAVPVLFVLAWRAPTSLWGQGAGALLGGLSCVSLGVLLGAVTPPGWLKLGILAMAGADAWLVFSEQLQAPNAALDAAAPGGGLPQLQAESFGSVGLGYGDLFVAGLLGALWSVRPDAQRAVALLTFVAAALFDLLFLVRSDLPATVPVAVSLLIAEGLSSGGRRVRTPRVRRVRSPRVARSPGR